MALHYVTRDYFVSESVYSAPFTVTNAAELDRVLERAEQDVDDFVGPWSRDSATGRKFGDAGSTNPQGLSDSQVKDLKDAVCAQALWRINAGPDAFVDSPYDSVSGPDFSTQGRRRRTSPQARSLLQGAGLVIRSARAV